MVLLWVRLLGWVSALCVMVLELELVQMWTRLRVLLCCKTKIEMNLQGLQLMFEMIYFDGVDVNRVYRIS